MRLTLAAVLPAALVAAAPARAQLPACEPARAGSLVVDAVQDAEQPPGSAALYATHRLDLRLRVDGHAEDLSPLDVAIRREASGPRTALSTIFLDGVSSGARDPGRPARFTRRFQRMTIAAGPRDARSDTRGLVTIAVRMPKVRTGRSLTRDFTLELGRGGTTLFSVRAPFRCRGLGSTALQICDATRFPVDR